MHHLLWDQTLDLFECSQEHLQDLAQLSQEQPNPHKIMRTRSKADHWTDVDVAWYHDKMLTRTPTILTQRYLTRNILVATVSIDATHANTLTITIALSR